VVEAECGRGATESASRRRELLGEVSFLPLNGRILELARLLVVPGAIPDKATAQMQRISPQRRWKSVNFYLSGTSGISRTFVSQRSERLSNHGYKKATICTPEELI
jgi:hypothetical protein